MNRIVSPALLSTRCEVEAIATVYLCHSHGDARVGHVRSSVDAQSDINAGQL